MSSAQCRPFCSGHILPNPTDVKFLLDMSQWSSGICNHIIFISYDMQQWLGSRVCSLVSRIIFSLGSRFNVKPNFSDTDHRDVWNSAILYTCKEISSTLMAIFSLIFSCDQATLRILLSFRPSLCPSVRPSATPFSQCSCHRIIMKFSGIITIDKSDVHAKCQDQRSKVKVTEVKTQLSRFRTVTPIWIYIWWWNDAKSFMLLGRGALLFFKVICQFSRSHG